MYDMFYDRYLKKEECNTTRQYNLDLLKALAIVAMVICHAVMATGAKHETYETDFWFNFADWFLGTYLVVAHGFMLCMGIGMVYTKKNTPRDFLNRGWKLLILAYVLNFFREGLIVIVFWLLGSSDFASAYYYTMCQDILHFAAWAFMLTALLKKLRLNNFFILCLGTIMSIIGSLVRIPSTGIWPLDTFIGQFLPNNRSCFSLFSWYFFVAVGLVFGDVLRRIKDLDRFYKRMLVISSVVMVVYVGLTCKFGPMFLTKDQGYYELTPLEACGLLSIDFFLMTVFYFLLKKRPPEKFPICLRMSKNLNMLYVIHWILIGWTLLVPVTICELVAPYWICYLYGVVIMVLSYLVMKWVEKRRQSRKMKKGGQLYE